LLEGGKIRHYWRKGVGRGAAGTEKESTDHQQTFPKRFIKGGVRQGGPTCGFEIEIEGPAEAERNLEKKKEGGGRKGT